MSKDEKISLRLTTQMKAALVAHAVANDRSMANLIVRILAEWLAAQKRKP